MRKRFYSFGLTAPMLFGLAVAAMAQEKTGCDAFAWPIAREQALFAGAQGGSIPSGTSLPAIPSGAISLELQSFEKVAFTVPPGRTPKAAGTFGGVVSMGALSKAGSYQVTLSDEAWIDVVQNGKEAATTAHSGKRDCPGVRKSVRFDLQAVPTIIQISGATAASIKIAILPAE